MERRPSYNRVSETPGMENDDEDEEMDTPKGCSQ